jgi:hypothetical protein
MMRDGRINMIGEGANDVLRVFTALVGMREVGLDLKAVLDALFNPIGKFRTLGGFASRRLGSIFTSPEVPVRNVSLDEVAARLSRLISHFGGQVERLLRHYQESILDRQYLLGRVADAATELYVSTCVLLRLDQMLTATVAGHDVNGHGSHGHVDAVTHVGNGQAEHSRFNDSDCQIAAGRYYLSTADRRIRRNLADLWDNDDAATTAMANQLLTGS